MTAKTGAGALVNPDNINLYKAEVIGLIIVTVALFLGSAESLLTVAGWTHTDERLRWTLFIAYDVLLVVLAMVTLAMRRRRAWFHVIWMSLLTIALVTASAFANYYYVASVTGLRTFEDHAGAYLKGSYPFLLLLAIEVLAAITSTRRQRTDSALVKARNDLKRERARKRELLAMLEVGLVPAPSIAWLERPSRRAARRAAELAAASRPASAGAHSAAPADSRDAL